MRGLVLLFLWGGVWLFRVVYIWDELVSGRETSAFLTWANWRADSLYYMEISCAYSQVSPIGPGSHQRSSHGTRHL